ncbi:MAG TPA: peptidase U32, partial [Clostridiales bacterium]|nr:peptidase U32 [Clostridiales bacterium]
MENKIELLSPAGDMDSLKAAVQCGADAVYFGAKSFNARRFANNIPDIGEAVSYALLRGVKTYLTLNTLVLDREFPSWASVAEQAARAGISAFIVQDLGGASVLRRMFPSIPLHASTQMTAANSENVRVLAQLGFSRVVLARELSANKIRRIAAHTSLEIEVFCHGALCVCYSGQCLMSSMLGARSANRGACAQPCRLLYQLEGREGYLLSTKDLCLIDELPALKSAGVHCIKIEGRMKSPAYVAAVTSAYRSALDGAPVTRRMRESLLLAFNRGGFTRGMFGGAKNRLYQMQPGNMGLPIGTVAARRGSSIEIKTDRALAPGDELMAARPNAEKQQIQSIAIENSVQIVTLKHAGQFSKGTQVSLLRSVEETRRLAEIVRAGKRKLPLSANCVIHAGSLPALAVTAPDGTSFCAQGAAPPQPAKTQALTEDAVRAQLCKTGDSPFMFSSLSIGLHPGLSLPKSALNALRRDALEGISAKLP